MITLQIEGRVDQVNNVWPDSLIQFLTGPVSPEDMDRK